jgi:hypothetical protein
VPFFAVNVVCLLRGDFAQAWRVYPQALGEEADVQCVREWVLYLKEHYADSPHVALFEGIFGKLDGSGEFVAEEVLAKHDETYMPPELAGMQSGKETTQ